MNENFVCSLRGLLVALGSEHGWKSFRKGWPRGGGPLVYVFGLGRVVGESWGFLMKIRVVLIHFESQVEGTSQVKL